MVVVKTTRCSDAITRTDIQSVSELFNGVDMKENENDNKKKPIRNYSVNGLLRFRFCDREGRKQNTSLFLV